ncbi:nuclear transport factor 2 family protein [Salinibacterium sp. ZJ454]|uniref:nuclear transport factor 2 family protein n=1 Tax=Salinibacterium sp. ZJ454 TaxID=2708339 RepID=UPI00141F7337|nr:nuclear transport factor 2 family protein [Salinibacterium sp. ZJ454]
MSDNSLRALEARLERLEDLRAIEQLTYRYTAACDFGYDLDGITACFMPEGRWASNGFAELVGHDAIRDYFRRLSRHTSQALHYATSPRIEIDETGLRARARFYLFCTATVDKRGSDVPDPVVILGSYDDICVKVDGEWLFEELRVLARSSSNWTEGWVTQPWREG